MSSATPRSRQIKDSSVSWEPFSAATRQALFHSSNCEGVIIATWAKKSLIDAKAISHLKKADVQFYLTTETGQSCGGIDPTKARFYAVEANKQSSIPAK